MGEVGIIIPVLQKWKARLSEFHNFQLAGYLANKWQSQG